MYTGPMVLDKCHKYSCYKRVDAFWSDLGEITLSYIRSTNDFLDDSNDNKTQRAFQWAIMSSIWSSGVPTNIDWNHTPHFVSLILHILTSLGRLDFWQGKWTPNWKIQDIQEIKLDKISNELSHTQCGHHEGLQKFPVKGDILRQKGAALKGKFLSAIYNKCCS